MKRLNFNWTNFITNYLLSFALMSLMLYMGSGMLVAYIGSTILIMLFGPKVLSLKDKNNGQRE